MKKTIITILLFYLFIGTIYSQDSIKVLTINKKEIFKPKTDQDLVDACKAWDLTKTDIRTILLKSKRITSYEKNSQCYYLPCEITGRLVRNDTIFNYRVNAAASSILFSKDVIYYYACRDTLCNKFFLLHHDSEDDN